MQASVHRLVTGLIAAALLLSSALLLGRAEGGQLELLGQALGLAFLVLAVFLGFRLYRSITTAENGRSE